MSRKEKIITSIVAIIVAIILVNIIEAVFGVIGLVVFNTIVLFGNLGFVVRDKNTK